MRKPILSYFDQQHCQTIILFSLSDGILVPFGKTASQFCFNFFFSWLLVGFWLFLTLHYVVFLSEAIVWKVRLKKDRERREPVGTCGSQIMPLRDT